MIASNSEQAAECLAGAGFSADEARSWLAEKPVATADFSADGKWASYVAVPDGTLWRCRTDGSDRRQLTSTPDRTALPRWSPDGSLIAWSASAGIDLIRPDGTGDHFLVGGFNPAWSPDRKHIIFASDRTSTTRQNDLVVMDADGSNVRQVTSTGDASEWSPRYSPLGPHAACDGASPPRRTRCSPRTTGSAARASAASTRRRAA